jgi:hypothetical protein
MMKSSSHNCMRMDGPQSFPAADVNLVRVFRPDFSRLSKFSFHDSSLVIRIPRYTNEYTIFSGSPYRVGVGSSCECRKLMGIISDFDGLNWMSCLRLHCSSTVRASVACAKISSLVWSEIMRQRSSAYAMTSSTCRSSLHMSSLKKQFQKGGLRTAPWGTPLVCLMVTVSPV